MKLRIVFFIILIGTATVLLTGLTHRFTPPAFDLYKSQFITSERILLDRNGKVLHEIRFNDKVRRFEWVPLKDIAMTLKKSVVLAEDKRFFSHHGVDWLSLFSAVYGRLTGKSRGGASTITMQLTDFLASLNGKKKTKRSHFEKVTQIISALYLESQWTKEQILEAYLNSIHFKGELQGVSASSYGLFEKNPSSLTIEESITMTVLIRSPNSSEEKIFERSCRLTKQLENLLTCTSQLKQIAKKINHTRYKIKPLAQDALHIARKIQTSGLFKKQIEINTTLDSEIQKLAMVALRKHVVSLKDQNMNDGAVVVIDNSSGNILAYVGNIGSDSKAAYVDGANALRQAGSTLKPFLYGAAFEKKLLTPASILNDSPLDIHIQGSGSYRPQNYDRNYHSFVTARIALASSLNIPAVKTIEMIGVPEFTDILSQLGLTDLERADFYGPSLALGSADVKLIQLTNAYRALANKGIWSNSQFLKATEPPTQRRIFSEQTAYLISHVLSDREARSTTFGLENMLSTRFWTAVKTGTSKDMRDNWCIGYSQRYTVGVWTGNFAGDSMWSVTGIQGAAPVWLEIMNALHSSTPSESPPVPQGIISKSVHFPQWRLTKSEVFIKGTEPAGTDIRFEGQPSSKIIYPLNGSYLALDPEIPSENQKVFINIENPTRKIKVYINSQELGPAEKYFLWKPKVGRHTLRLIDVEKNIVDEVQFEIKGKKTKT